MNARIASDSRMGDESRERYLRMPPHSVEAEQSVLGGLMMDPSALSKIVDTLKADDFYLPKHQALYRAFCELSDRGDPVDAVSMSDWLRENGLEEISGGASYVIELANATPGTANIVGWSDMVLEKANLRNLVHIGESLASAAFKPGKSSADLVAAASQHLNTMVASRARGGLRHVRQGVKRLWAAMHERYEESDRTKLIGLETPWAGLNKLTKGLRNGQVYVVGARPSMGKSIFGGQIWAHVAMALQQRAALFAIEGTEDELLRRICSDVGNIPFVWMDDPDKEDPNEGEYWNRFTAVSRALTQSGCFIDDTPYLRIEQLMARARREHQSAPLRIIIIDHLHDMDLGTEPAKLRMAIGHAVQGAKTLAKELNIPVVLLAQLNRSIAQRADKRPTLMDLRESGDIEQKADVVMFLHREDYYDTTEHQTHLKGVIELIPAKGRNLRVGSTIHLANRFDHMRMVDWHGALPLPKSLKDDDEKEDKPRFKSRKSKDVPVADRDDGR